MINVMNFLLCASIVTAATLCNATADPTPKHSDEQCWEYKTIEWILHDSAARDKNGEYKMIVEVYYRNPDGPKEERLALDSLLNMFGQQGWELAEVTFHNIFNGDKGSNIMYFKRPCQTKSEDLKPESK